MEIQLTEKGIIMLVTLACATILIATEHNSVLTWVMFAL